MNEPRPEMMPEAPVMTEAPVSGQDAGAAPDVLPSAADLPPGDDDEEELPLPPEDSRPEPGAVTWEGDGDAPASSPAAGTGGGEPPLPPAPSAAAPASPDGGKKEEDDAPEDDEPMTLLGHLGELRRRLQRDIAAGLRDEGIVARSLERATHYKNMGAAVIDTTRLTPEETAHAVADILREKSS